MKKTLLFLVLTTVQLFMSKTYSQNILIDELKNYPRIIEFLETENISETNLLSIFEEFVGKRKIINSEYNDHKRELFRRYPNLLKLYIKVKEDHLCKYSHSTEKPFISSNIYNSITDESNIIVPDFLVNEIDIGRCKHEFPNIAVTEQGDFVIVWKDKRNARVDIYAQRYSSNGYPISENFKVNDGLGAQMDFYNHFVPSIAIDFEGNFIISWLEARDGISNIYGQRFNEDGIKSGANFIINDEDGSNPSGPPTIGMNKDGQIVITWSDHRNSFGTPDIYAQRYTIDGNKIGENFQVNDETSSSSMQFEPNVCIDTNGNFNIVWSDGRNGNFEIYAQRFTSEANKIEENFLVNDDIDSEVQHSRPAISFDNDDNFLIIWDDFRNGNCDIYMQRYDYSGEKEGNNVLVNDDTGGALQAYPSIAIDANGNSIITWFDRRYGYDIFFQRYASDGSKVEGNIKIEGSVGGSYPSGPVGVDVNGKFIIAWQDERHGYLDIYLQQYTADANVIGENIMVNDDNGSASQHNPAIWANSDNIVIAWEDARYGNTNGYYGHDIYAQCYESDGSKVGNNFKVNDDLESTIKRDPAIAADSIGNYVITWSDERNGKLDVYAQAYTKNNDKIGVNFRVSDNEIVTNIYPAIAMYKNGNYIITWLSWENGNYAIYAQQFSSDGSKTGQIFKIIDCGENAPSIGVGEDNNFLIAWIDTRNGIYDVFAQKYKYNGSKIDEKLRINEVQGSARYFPSIAVDNNGNFIIGWLDWRNGQRDVYAQLYNSTGMKVNNNFKVNESAVNWFSSDFNLSIGVNNIGNIIIIWEDGINTYPDLFAQKYDSFGNKIGYNFLVHDSAETVTQSNPDVTFANDNLYFTWEDSRYLSKGMNIYANIQSFYGQDSLIVNAPNGGETWQVGSTHQITWTSQNIDNIKIEYTTNNGTNWSTVVSSELASAGNYSWTIPNTISDQCLVRISDASDGDPLDISDAVFTISAPPTITVTSPNGGERWEVGETRIIYWNFVNVENSIIEYSTDNGNSWEEIVTVNHPRSGGVGYDWLIPDTPSEQCLVRISDVTDSTDTDISDAVFTIYKSAITLVSPNGTEIWDVASRQTIKWQSDDVENINLEYSTNNGSVWAIIDTNINSSLGEYSWTVPNTPSTQCLMKVSDTESIEVSDLSDAPFTISTVQVPVISLSRPVGGEVWFANTSQEIVWVSQNVDNIKIDFSSDNGQNWETIAAPVNASFGAYSWNVPVITSGQCKIMVTDISNNDISDTTQTVFEIRAASLSLTVPNGGEEWVVGDPHKIEWESTNINRVDLMYSTDNGNSWNLIGESIDAGGGIYDWTLPNTPSENCFIKIINGQDDRIFDVSDNTFSIKAATGKFITLVRPNGGEVFRTFTYEDIQWVSNEVENVSLDYTTDGGISWLSLLISTNASLGNFSWYIPNIISNQCLVRVKDYADPSVSDTSDGFFSIKLPEQSSITLLSPNGGEQFLVGEDLIVEWESSNVLTVRIEFSENFGIYWNAIAASIPASQGTISWAIDGFSSENCLIRVISEQDENVYGQSSSVFSVEDYPQSITLSASLGFFSGNNVNSYKMLGLPGDVNIPVTNFLTENQNEDWRVFYDNGASENYLIEYSDGSTGFNFSPGKGFWVISRYVLTIDRQANNVQLDEQYSYSIPLQEGWNIISNPFVKNIAWVDIQSLNSVTEILWEYSSGFNEASNFSPYKGYYFRNTTGISNLKIPYMYKLEKKPAPTLLKDGSEENVLRLNFLHKDFNRVVVIGINENSNVGYDPMDKFAPPGDFEKERIVIYNKDLETDYKYLYKDYRPEIGDIQIYVIKLKTIPNKTVNLVAEGLQQFDDNEIYLIDTRLNDVYNIKENNRVEFKSVREEYEFNLIIGKKEFVEKIKNDLIPKEYILYQNYPNPFNSGTVIRFSIPEKEKVTIEIYSILGEKILTVADNEFLEAGYYEKYVDLNRLSSGVYLYRLKTSNYSSSRKMLFIK